MPTRSDAAWLRRRIGRELRALREGSIGPNGKPITTPQAAEELGCVQSKITNIEQGKNRLNWRDVRDLALFYGAPDATRDRLIEWAKRSTEPLWWSPYAEVVRDWFADFVGGESEAEREVSYEQMIVSGILQTKRYAEAITELSGPHLSKRDRELVVSLRMERQERLHEDQPLQLEAFIEETVLRRPVGDPSIMREQLQALIDASLHENVSIRVLPTSLGYHPGVEGRFDLLEFEEFPPAVYLQHRAVAGARYGDDPDLVDDYKLIVNELRRIALSEAKSVGLIRTITSELYDTEST